MLTLAGWLGIWILLLMLWRKRLTVGTVQRRRLLAIAPDGMCGHEGLGLRGHGREDTFLRETLAIGASAVFRRLESRAADLRRRSAIKHVQSGREVVFTLRRLQ